MVPCGGTTSRTILDGPNLYIQDASRWSHVVEPLHPGRLFKMVSHMVEPLTVGHPVLRISSISNTCKQFKVKILTVWTGL